MRSSTRAGSSGSFAVGMDLLEKEVEFIDHAERGLDVASERIDVGFVKFGGLAVLPCALGFLPACLELAGGAGKDAFGV